ncbi:MAG: sugar ABC transporter permease [Cypionkella sp.]|jgi:multiple sugar transport system permease protein|nr:sugar ABC transporter permease [Cypionkella sp.]
MAIAARHHGRTSLRQGRSLTLIALVGFLGPALLTLFAFRLLPTVLAGYQSLQTPDGLGLDNYAALWASPTFIDSIRVTLIYNIILNPLQIVIALALALLLNQSVPGRTLGRIAVFLPVAAPLAVASLVWGIAMRPSDGALNALLGLIGLSAQPWLTSADQALMSIMIIVTWAGVGYWTVFLIAGLREIPDELYEAATIDGAGWWRCLFFVTLPMLKRTILFVLVANTVGNFLVFAPVQILTRGGPQGSTNLFIHEIYQLGFSFADMPAASAGVVLLLVCMLLFVAFQFRLLRSE